MNTKLADRSSGTHSGGRIRTIALTANPRLRRDTGEQPGRTRIRTITPKGIRGPTPWTQRENIWGREGRIGIPDSHGEDARKIAISMDRAVLDSRSGERNVYARYAGRGDPSAKSKWVPAKSIRGAHTTEPLHKKYGPHAAKRRPTFWRRIVLGRGAHDVIKQVCILM